jgi:hypothetical protein
MKVYRGVEVHFYPFLTLAKCGCQWTASCFSCFTPRKNPSTHCIRRLGRAQSWCVCFGDEKNPLAVPESELQIVQPVAGKCSDCAIQLSIKLSKIPV